MTTCSTGSNIGNTEGAQLPKIFYVNWFRRDDDNSFLWPGFSENSRVLKWVFERVSRHRRCRADPGSDFTPVEGGMDPRASTSPMSSCAEALAIKPEEWETELGLIEDWYAELGDSVPTELRAEVENLRKRLGLA